MTTLDIVILVIFALGAIRGLMTGFIKQLASLLGLVVGLLAAKALYAGVAERISPLLGESPTASKVVAFVLIWIAVPLAFSLVAALLTKAMEAISLGWLNRWLGGGLGAIKYLLAASLLICVVEWIDPEGDLLINKEQKKQSQLYYPLQDLAGVFIPTAKEFIPDMKVPDVKMPDVEEVVEEIVGKPI